MVQLHATRCMVKPRHACSCHVAILSAMRPLRRIFLDLLAYTVFCPDFRGSFWRPSGAQNGSCRVPLEILRGLLSNDIKFTRIGVRTKSYGPQKSGRLSYFFAFSRRRFRPNGGCYGEPRVASRSQSYSLSYVPELEDQIAASRKESAHEGSCPGGKMRRIFNMFSLFSSAFVHTVNVAPDVGFRRS